jgi:hypothetical protein
MRSSRRRRSFSLAIAAGFIGTVWLMAQSAKEFGDTEHRIIPFIEKFRSIKESVKKFGGI